MNKLNATRLYACLCLFVMALTTSYAQDNVIDEVVWIVGDEAILKSDVENERLNAQYEGRHFDGDPYCVIPEELAVQKLFLHQAEIDSVEVSDPRRRATHCLANRSYRFQRTHGRAV